MTTWVESLVAVFRSPVLKKSAGEVGSTAKEDDGDAGCDDGSGVVFKPQYDIFIYKASVVLQQLRAITLISMDIIPSPGAFGPSWLPCNSRCILSKPEGRHKVGARS